MTGIVGVWDHARHFKKNKPEVAVLSKYFSYLCVRILKLSEL